MINRFILFLLPLVLPAYVVRFHLGPLPTTLLELVLMGSLVAWTVVRGKNGWTNALIRLKEKGWILPMICWIAVGFIACIVAEHSFAALGLWRAYFIEPLLVFIMLADLIRTEEDKRILTRSLIAITTLLALYALFQFITHLGIPKPWDTPPNGIRATGPFPFPNALALFATPVAAWCFTLIIHGRSKIKHTAHALQPLFPWIGFLSGAICILLAKSVGGMIGLGVAMFVALILQKRWRVIVITTALIGLATIFAIPMTRNIVQKKILFQEWSGKVRLVMWQETVTMLRDHPILGVGLGGYPDGIKPYHRATWMEIFQYPHNILLNLWSELGVLGIIVFGWIIWRWARSGRMAYAPTGSHLPVITALLIHGLVDVPYFKNDLAVLFWILVALTIFTAGPCQTEAPDPVKMDVTT